MKIKFIYLALIEVHLLLLSKRGIFYEFKTIVVMEINPFRIIIELCYQLCFKPN